MFPSNNSPNKPILDISDKEYKKMLKRYKNSKGDKYPVGTIIGSGDYPVEPTEEDIEFFRQHRDEIVRPLVMKDIKKHGGIFHGRHNINQEYIKRLGKKKAQSLIKETYDYDVWVGYPRARAERMQHELDKEMHCDIAYAVKQPAPRDAKARWIVRSRANMDNPEVDYVSYPNPDVHPYKTVKENGIEHETLESSIAREYVLKNHPMRSIKAMKSILNYNKYLNIKNRRSSIMSEWWW